MYSAMEFLRYDFLLQGKPGVFPPWYERRYRKEAHDASLAQNGLISSRDKYTGPGISRRTVYSRTEYDVFKFDQDKESVPILFIYQEDVSKTKKVRCIRLRD